jgi:hypothetical protein
MLLSKMAASQCGAGEVPSTIAKGVVDFAKARSAGATAAKANGAGVQTWVWASRLVAYTWDITRRERYTYILPEI